MNFERLRAVSPRRHSGVILCKAHHAEFAGPGAAVGGGLDRGVHQMLIVGELEWIELTSPRERQVAYQKRIQWLNWLQQITRQIEPEQRAQRLVTSFEMFFGRSLVAEIPVEVLARLVGTFPDTIDQARQHNPVRPAPCQPLPLKTVDLPEAVEPRYPLWQPEFYFEGVATP